MENNTTEVFIGGEYINIQTLKVVELQDTLTLIDDKHTSTILNIKITADFSKIPEKYHEVFLNMLSSKYYGKVSFGDNPFSQCLPPKKKRWYQFWR
jgi:hypothetical protein